MIAVFLVPFPVRAVPAPYLWVFYKMLSAYRERVLFLIGEDYIADPQRFAAEGRWEVGEHACNDYGYRIPSRSDLEQHALRFLPADLFHGLLRECLDNPLEAFRRMLTRRIPQLEAAIDQALTAEIAGGAKIEAIVTWCNCPSLTAIANRHDIRVVHLEVGPLRAPEYRPTAYFDFSGVNGHTEAAARFAAIGGEPPAFDLVALRGFFTLQSESPQPAMGGRVGVALQVEDDSNLVAYGNGFDNQSLIVHAKLKYGGRAKLVVRSHPGSGYWLKPGQGFELDQSPDSIAFVRGCSRILTINSSVGLESVLWGVPVTVLGDTSYAFLLEARDNRALLARLAFYLYGYLVPRQALFDLAYLRFRLTQPSEARIVAYHLQFHVPDHDAAGADLEDNPWRLIASVLGDSGR
ncbi:MAG: hypothetical protein E6R14_10205 [Thermomicrobiales bacterium]|nr:MAG: hypothetical protein E6R14_10205 [Thermomicrobiales bacterium]HNB04395.1 hypothetical protein [Thauera aminoaromatica]